MIAHRAAIFLAGAASLAVFATPSAAQVDESIVLNIMRECARIDDPTARLACYDNNIRDAGGNPRNTVPGETVVRGGPGAPLSGGGGAADFGRENIPTPDRFRSAPSGEIEELTARISEIRRVSPGRYLVTLQSGAVWRFTDSVSNTWRVPREGDDVEISRAAMGSFLLRFDGQQSVRVERVR